MASVILLIVVVVSEVLLIRVRGIGMFISNKGEMRTVQSKNKNKHQSTMNPPINITALIHTCCSRVIVTVIHRARAGVGSYNMMAAKILIGHVDKYFIFMMAEKK
jgi:hypothetical protein